MFMEQSREQWGTRWGFILAAAGSAIGLGNIWRFPYLAGENGGAAFIIIYILCVIFIGLPLMLAEFMIGRRGGGDAVQSFRNIAPGKRWFVAGGIGVLAAFVILTYYGVVAGWALKYFLAYLTGGLWSPPADGFESYFLSFIASPLEPIVWQAVMMALTIGVVIFGIKGGIEKASLFLMPLLGLLVIILAIYGVSLEGSNQGLSFLFNPDWSSFADPKVYVAALGQMFFSLSLGMGIMLTYGSYINPTIRLPQSAGTIVTFDTIFAILAGLMIFPALFAFGGNPGQGPGLLFITMPDVFASMGSFGIVIGLLFFLLVVIAALTSMISLLEVSTAYFMRKLSLDRKKTTLLVGIIIFILGIPSSLGNGPWGHITLLPDKAILDTLDYIANSFLLPISGVLSVLFVGWAWKKEEVLRESQLASRRLVSLLIWLLRIPVPILIVVILISMATG